MSRVFMSRTEKSMLDKKLVGAYINKKDANRIALLSLEKGIPRTAIILPLLESFLKEQESISVMIENAVNRALRAWKERKEQNSSALAAYCKELVQDLRTHRIEKDIAQLIIKKFREKV